MLIQTLLVILVTVKVTVYINEVPLLVNTHAVKANTIKWNVRGEEKKKHIPKEEERNELSLTQGNAHCSLLIAHCNYP